MKKGNKALYESIMRNVAKTVMNALNESTVDKSELMEAIDEFYEAGEDIGYERLYVALDNEDPTLMRIFNTYDPYVQDVLDMLLNPVSPRYDIINSIKEMAEHNEWETGTEPRCVVYFIQDITNWMTRH